MTNRSNARKSSDRERKSFRKKEIRKATEYLRKQRRKIRNIDRRTDLNRQQKTRRMTAIFVGVARRIQRCEFHRRALRKLVCAQNKNALGTRQGASEHLPLLRYLRSKMTPASTRRHADAIDICLHYPAPWRVTRELLLEKGVAALSRGGRVYL